MKKSFKLLALLALPIILTGCTSNITAKFDDFNETFTGKSYYDPTNMKATVELKSDVNNSICFGNAYTYTKVIPVWQFNLSCSDGRKMKGTLHEFETEGKGFTSRNEHITFTVSKKQTTINAAKEQYLNEIKSKPVADHSQERIKVYMD